MMNARLELHKLKKHSDGPAQAVQLVAEHRPAHEFTKFFFDKQELQMVLSRGSCLSSVPLWSVSSKPMALEMKRRGFIQLTHHPVVEWCNMPSGATPVPTTSSTSTDEPLAPTTFRMPSRVPDVKGTTSALQIARMFERVATLVVEERGDMKDEHYSPLRLWSAHARGKSPLDKGQTTRFSAACKIYVYIRVGLCKPPAEIQMTYGELRTKASQWSKGEGRSDCPGEHWFARAVAEYEREHSI